MTKQAARSPLNETNQSFGSASQGTILADSRTQTMARIVLALGDYNREVLHGQQYHLAAAIDDKQS